MTRDTSVEKTGGSAEWLHVEVVYALPRGAVVIKTRCRPGTTLAQVIHASGILERFPDIDLGRNPVGVFGARAAPGARVANGDRIEIYRPLIVDPKTARRLRGKGKYKPV